MHKTLDTPYVYLELKDDPLIGTYLIGTYKKNPRLTFAMAKEIVKARLEFTGPEPVVGLIFNEGVKSLDKKARDYLASDEGIKGLKAVAYVLDNSFSSFLANFFIAVGKAKLPIRVFSKRDAAMKWLGRFRNN
jgi:hypothetical protein